MEPGHDTAKQSLLAGATIRIQATNFVLFFWCAAKGCRDISRAAPRRSPLRAWRNW